MRPKQSVLNYSLWLLGRRDYSTQEIADKLKRKEYPAEEIEGTLKKLKELKFLDDERFTKQFVANQQARGATGNRLIFMKLLKKGINKELINQYLVKTAPEALEETALKWLKKHSQKEVANKKGKLFQYLAGRGFDYDEILEVLSSELIKTEL